ncbi:PIR protein [Plasmodium vivax]|nr:PIR protein [Plasmodium vivax]
MCSKGPNEENYEFFENIEEYIKKAKSAETTNASSNAVTKCKSFMVAYGSRFKAEETARTICEHFINLYNSLNEPKCNLNSDPKNKKCCKFLKYWVNSKLSKSMKNETQCVHSIYNGLESQITGPDGFIIDLEFKDDINKDDLNKMNILYRLHKIYTDINGILENDSEDVKKTLSSLSTACCTDYLVANYMCNGGNGDDSNNSQFCIQLKKFKTTYEKLYNTVDGKGPEYSKNFIKLTQCNNNIMSTALIGTTVGLVPLLVGLYKFTPIRQFINSKKGKLTQEYRNNDDEMTNAMLMDQQSEYIGSQQGTYNIKYHSV